MLLAGCQATVPPVVRVRGDLPEQASSATASGPDFEQRQKDRALALQRQGRLAEAALAWEVLVVLRPDLPSYQDQWADARHQIEVAVAERWQQAIQAQQSGNLDQATRAYLAVLALQPDHAQAASALRTLERDRNKRTYLDKTVKGTPPGSRPSVARVPAGKATVADRAELEHAALLTSQGEYDDAIALLEQRLAAGGGDDVVRALLADAFFQKAEELAARDPASAIRALEKCVQLEPTHPLAAERLEHLRATMSSRPRNAPVAAP